MCETNVLKNDTEKKREDSIGLEKNQEVSRKRSIRKTGERRESVLHILKKVHKRRENRRFSTRELTREGR